MYNFKEVEMTKMNQRELDRAIVNHQKYLEKDPEGLQMVLKNCDLSGLNFTCNKFGVEHNDLQYIIMENCICDDANFDSTMMCFGKFNNCSFGNAKMQCTDLAYCSFKDVSFNGADMSASDLRGSDFGRISCGSASSTLVGTNLEAAKVSYADLSYCDMRLSNLDKADLDNSNLMYAVLLDATVTERTSLTDCNMAFVQSENIYVQVTNPANGSIILYDATNDIVRYHYTDEREEFHNFTVTLNHFELCISFQYENEPILLKRFNAVIAMFRSYKAE